MKPPKRNGQPQTSRSTASSESDNTQRNDLQVGASFSVEAEKIKQLHESVLKHVRHVVNEAIQIGGLLVKVKNKLEHGQWLPWLKASMPFSQQTASNYMKCHENRKRLKLLNVSNLTDAYLLAYPQRQRPKSNKPSESDDEPTQPEPSEEPEPHGNVVLSEAEAEADSGEPLEGESQPRGKADDSFGLTPDEIYVWLGKRVKNFFSVLSDQDVAKAEVLIAKALFDDEALGGEPTLKYPNGAERTFQQQLDREQKEAPNETNP